MTTWRYRRPDVLRRLRLDRDTVIEASAGTGKTFTLEHLVVDLLLRGGARLEQILVVTFTEKATREMQQRVRSKIDAILHPRRSDTDLNPEDDPDPWVLDDERAERLRDALNRFDRAPISTIHGFCQRVLSEHAFDSGGLFQQEQVDGREAFGRAFREEVRYALGRDDLVGRALQRVMEQKGVDLESQLFAWFSERGVLHPEAPSEDAELESADEAFVALVHYLIPRIRARLDTFKRQRGQMDFDDMLARVRDALRGEGGRALRDELRGTYRFALVDEFQDTDEVQWEIFRRVFFEGPHNVLFVIGDPKQAIYGFRGADVHTYLKARKHILGSGSPVVLSDNYRSTSDMIDGYNRIVGQDFFSGAVEYEPVRCGRPELAATDADGRPAAAMRVLHLVGRGKLVADDLKATLHEQIAQEIQRLVDRPLWFGSGDEARPLGYEDMHILTRSGPEAQQVGEVLRRHGIPHAFFKQEGLFQTAEAQHLRDVLRAVEDPSDRSRRLRAWLTPLFALRLEDLNACRELPEGHPLMARLYRWKELADNHDYAALTRALVQESGLVRRELFLRHSERQLTNYLHILEFLLERAHASRRGLAELVSELDSYVERRAYPPGETSNIQRLESERHAVQILTMHKAKGLEAPIVFLAGGLTTARPGKYEPRIFRQDGERHAWIGSPPDKSTKNQVGEENRQEDERLLYVALTRAKARLYLPYLGDPPSGRARSDRQYKFSHLHGSYRVVNDRLKTLAQEGAFDGPEGPFEYTEVDVKPPPPAAAPQPPQTEAWEPPAELLQPPPDESTRYETARRQRGGFVVTSYTRLKSGRQAELDVEQGEEFTAESVDPSPVDTGDPLPGGSSVGVFLHEVLETLSFERIARAPDFAEWADGEGIRAAFVTAARRNGVAASAVEPAQRLLFDALRAPVRAGPLSLEGGIASIERSVAEMTFHFPLPEHAHPQLGQARPSPEDWPFAAERGFVRGVVDLVFEHEGRLYFLDYKSDRLAEWSAAAVQRHVAERYELQARLYALGVLRMLELSDEQSYEERFGGLLYCFLRGMAQGDGHGVHFERPEWHTVRDWESELRHSNEPWGYPLQRGRP
jgi:exodeoxyribonuclease V beta subunit